MIKPHVFRLGNQILDQYIPPIKEFKFSIKLGKHQWKIYNQFLGKIEHEGANNVITLGNSALLCAIILLL